MARKPKERPGMYVYWDIGNFFRKLPKEEAGALVVMMLDFSQHGIEPDLTEHPMIAFIWDNIKERLVLDAERYEKMRERNSAAGIKSAEARKNVNEC